MLTPDIMTLKAFYATPVGQETCRLISASLAGFWPQAKNECILGMGYATPYLAAYLEESDITIACMPAHQGAAYWPANRTNLVFLAQESQLPLRENFFNRVLCVHSLETSDRLEHMLKDIWRVLVPGGRVLVIVPNRLGLWARSSRSPFGYGLPFSMQQLKNVMNASNFTVTRSASALFTPPAHSRLVWRAANFLERVGKLSALNLGGVLLLEAEKQIYAGVQQLVPVRNYVGAPATTPVMTMNRLCISLY